MPVLHRRADHLDLHRTVPRQTGATDRGAAAATASASMGLSSWKDTSSRRVNSHVVGSTWFHSVARNGSISPSYPYFTSVSRHPAREADGRPATRAPRPRLGRTDRRRPGDHHLPYHRHRRPRPCRDRRRSEQRVQSHLPNEVASSVASSRHAGTPANGSRAVDSWIKTETKLHVSAASRTLEAEEHR